MEHVSSIKPINLLIKWPSSPYADYTFA